MEQIYSGLMKNFNGKQGLVAILMASAAWILLVGFAIAVLTLISAVLGQML